MGRVSKLGWDNVDFKYLYTEDGNDIFPIQWGGWLTYRVCVCIFYTCGGISI